MKNEDRIDSLEQRQRSVEQRVSVLSDQLSHALEAMRAQTAQLMGAAEAQRSLSLGWASATQLVELERARADRAESALFRQQVQLDKLQDKTASGGQSLDNGED